LEGLEGFGRFGAFAGPGVPDSEVALALGGLLGKVFGGFWRDWMVLKGVGTFGRFWRVWKVWKVLEGVWRVWKVLEGLEGLEGFGGLVRLKAGIRGL
jgi:hypothetical protein